MDRATLIGLSNETYEILEKLGEGGFGEVYLARKQPLGKLVAIKLLQRRVSTGAEQRLWEEARLLASLHHPGIVAADDLVRLEGRLGLVTEYIEGEDLSVCFKSGMPASAVVEVVGQVAWALHAAAQQGVVHRDVKPGNIRLGRYGNAKLLDFGSARARDQEDEPHHEMSGTPRYMAPERFELEVIPASDVFSLGCILWLGVKGRHFYRDYKTFDRIYALTRSEASWNRLLEEPSSRARTPGVPEGLERLMKEMLARDSQARPSAMEVARRCEAMLEIWPGRVRLSDWCLERWPHGPPAGRPQRIERSVPSLSFGSEESVSDASREDDTTAASGALQQKPLPLSPPVGVKAVPPARPPPPDERTQPFPKTRSGARSPALWLGMGALGLLLCALLLGGGLVALLLYGGPPETAQAQPQDVTEAPEVQPGEPSEPSPAPRAEPSPDTPDPPAPARPPQAKPAQTEPAQAEPTPSQPAPARPTSPKPRPARGLSDPAAIRDMISRKLASLTPGLTLCYEQRSRMVPSLQGRWSLTFTVQPSGEVGNVAISALGQPDAELERCIVERVRSRWTFEPIAQPQPVSRTLRFP